LFPRQSIIAAQRIAVKILLEVLLTVLMAASLSLSFPDDGKGGARPKSHSVDLKDLRGALLR
jgi:hypothetical protein